MHSAHASSVSLLLAQAAPVCVMWRRSLLVWVLLLLLLVLLLLLPSTLTEEGLKSPLSNEEACNAHRHCW